MKMDLAVYTAQEGYSWQPGTVYSAEELKGFKDCIGKFPAPDAADFPIGGVFLKGERVVFYRYHVAKKIDFRGRDALYCVLGALPVEAAGKVDPAQLFALPQFAAPQVPFPLTAEVPVAEPGRVPEWLKSLSGKALDVRIAGSAEKLSYAVNLKDVSAPATTAADSAKAVSKVSVEPAFREPVTPPIGKPQPIDPKFNPLTGPRIPLPEPSPWLWILLAFSVLIALGALAYFAYVLLWATPRPTPKEAPADQKPISAQAVPEPTAAVATATNKVEASAAQPVQKPVAQPEKKTAESGPAPVKKADEPKSKPVVSKPAPAKPAVSKPMPAKSVTPKPAQAKPAAPKPAQEKPASQKPAAPKPPASKPVQAKPAK